MAAQVPPAPAERSSRRGAADLGALAVALEEALREQCALQARMHAEAAALGRAVTRRDSAAVAAAAAAQQQSLDELGRTAALARARAAALRGALRLPGGAGLAALGAGLQRAGVAGAGLQGLQAEVAASGARVRAANARNAPLLRQALAFTDFALRALTAARAAGYTEAGLRRREGQRRLLDTRA